MKYAGFLLRRERLARNWSQEGLCRDICTVSYLSKIEQGKAAPSPELLRLLMKKMGLPWYGSQPDTAAWIEDAYAALLRHDPGFPALIFGQSGERFLYSPMGADWLLLEQFARPQRKRLDPALEACMDSRQLALQRLLQNRYEDAMRLYPCAFCTCAAGSHDYAAGDLAAAVERMQAGYQQAAEEGHPRIMLHCKLILGNCYSNRHDLAAMERHYRVARNLAEALGDTDALESIDYNTAATRLEAGQYRQALSYFEKKDQPSRMDLHKLAICYEKLGMLQAALDTVDQAAAAKERDWLPEGLEDLMLSVVRIRLTEPSYQRSSVYGEALLECFRRCREELSSGYALFHLPWVLEWYEANRQYKQALALLKHFPDYQANHPLTTV